MSDHAIPGDVVAEYSCGFRDDEGGYCGEPVAYEIRFRGWPPFTNAGSCQRHVIEARELDVERIWSVTR